MFFAEIFKISIKSIFSNKLRAFLTMLGIIIGISSVITIMSLGQGGQKAILGEFEKIGVNIFDIRLKNDIQISQNDYFTIKDAEHLKDRIDKIKAATPIFQTTGIVKTEKITKRAFIISGNADLSSISNISILYGRFLNQKDIIYNRNVALIDSQSAKKLFGYTDCVGKTINIGTISSMQSATIIGVFDGEGMQSLSMLTGGQSIVTVIMPITLAQKIFGERFYINQIRVLVYKTEQLDFAQASSKRIIGLMHHNLSSDKYKTEGFINWMEQFNKILGIFTAIMSSIAAISLIVGGIGVMNIMLVSVTERTREIGIRKALGARRKDILVQFLIESLIISLIGGIIGMGLGVLLASIIGPRLNITPVISLSTVLIAFVFSSAVGIFFGMYPANKASKLDPIQALRYE